MRSGHARTIRPTFGGKMSGMLTLVGGGNRASLFAHDAAVLGYRSRRAVAAAARGGRPQKGNTRVTKRTTKM
jgi:hypothetical protein